MSEDIYQAVRRGASVKEIYEIAISKYEGEVKGFTIMIRQEELSDHSEHVKERNIDILKKELRKAKYSLTRTKNLLKAL